MFKLKRNSESDVVKEEPPKIEESPKEEIEATDDITQKENASDVKVTEETNEVKGKKSKKKEGKEEKKVIKWGPNRILQCFAYFSVVLIAIAMILRLIFKDQPDISIYMQGVGECLAYIVCIWLGFYFTRKRGNIWWLIGWIIASVILVIFYIFAIA